MNCEFKIDKKETDLSELLKNYLNRLSIGEVDLNSDLSIYDSGNIKEERKNKVLKIVNDAGKYFASNKGELKNYLDRFSGEGKYFPIFNPLNRVNNTLNEVSTLINQGKSVEEIKNYVGLLEIVKAPPGFNIHPYKFSEEKEQLFKDVAYSFNRKLVGEKFRSEISRNIHNRIHKSDHINVFSKELMEDLKEYFPNYFDGKKFLLQEELNLFINKAYKKIDTLLKGEERITEAQLTNYKAEKSTDDVTVGTADIITIDDSGILKIYDIKVSSDPYSSWSLAKKNTALFEVGTHKALLEYNINNPETGTFLIVVEIPENITVTTLNKDFSVKVQQINEDLNKVQKTSKSSINEIIQKTIGVTLYPKNTEQLFTDFSNTLKVILPEYKIKKKKGNNFNFEDVIEKNKPYFNPYSEYFKKETLLPELKFLTENYIYSDNKEEFKKLLDIYYTQVSILEEKNIEDFKAAFNEAKANKKPSLIFNNISYNHFSPYLKGTWEIVETLPELSSMGIILFYNSVDNIYDALNISGYNYTDSLKIDDDFLTYRELDAIKALAFLDVYKKHLQIGTVNKIGSIGTMFLNGSIVSDNREDVLKKYRELVKSGTNLSEGSVEKDFMDVVDLGLVYLNSLRDVDSEYYSILEDLTETNIEEKIEELLDRDPGLKSRVTSKSLNPELGPDLLVILLSRAYLAKKGYVLEGDSIGLSEYSLNFNSIFASLLYLFNVKSPKYDSRGKANEYIFGGITTTTPDRHFSKDIRYFNEIINAIVNNVREEEIKESAKIRKITTEYYKYKNYTGQFQKLTWGTTSHLYENLYEDLSILKLKDPYIDATLLPEERSYLKKKLLLLNAYFLHLTPKELDLLDPENPETFSQIDRLQLRYTSGDYFLLPLVKSQYISAHKEFFKSPVTHVINSFKETLNDITKQNYTASEIKDLEKNVNELTMPDRSRSQNTREKRQQMINSSGIAYFDINLDTVAHAFMDNAVKVKAMKDQKILIASFLTEWAAKNKDHKTKDKVWNHLIAHLKVAGYGQHNIDEEFEDVNTVARILKGASSLPMLGLRPAMLAKEFTLGVLKGFGMASLKIYGKHLFGAKELSQAYLKLFTIKENFSTEFHTIDRLNQFYGLANMDIAGFYQKLQKDRHGITKALTSYLFSTSVVGDYFNKLSLFIAMMLKDGSYNAHTIVEDQLVYDVTKDERFSHYFAKRDAYKVNGKFSVHPSDDLYNEQRARYLFLASEINKENEKHSYSESNLIEKAYSQAEGNSFVTMAETAYGYYRKDFQASMLQKWYGPLFLQFAQFWPAKMVQWFGGPKESGQTNQIILTNKIDPKTGQQIYKNIIGYDENGVEIFEEVLTDTGLKAMEFQGTPTEGLIYSLGFLIKNAATFNKDSLKKEEWRTRQGLFAIWDGLLLLLFIKGLLVFFASIRPKDKGIGKEGTDFAINVLQKMEREANVIDNTIFQFSLDPVSVSYFSRAASNLDKALNSNITYKEFFGRTAGAFEMLKERE